MTIMHDHQDAFGHLMLDYHNGIACHEMIERDDGSINTSGGPAFYFQEYDEWADCTKKAMDYVQGRVLDVGCGAGRHSLYLQGKGFEVLGIDNSPNAVEVCRQRGVKKTKHLSITQITRDLGVFDTILLMGGGFGLMGSFKRARWLLKRFNSITSAEGRIIAQTRDPYKTDDPDHLAYHEFNRRRGRMGGQVRFKVRYKKYATPWIDWLHASVEEMKEIVDDTGWKIDKILPCDAGAYVAVITKV